MTSYLPILIVLFIAIAIWQMVKIFDLTQANVSNDQVATDKDNRINGYLMMGFLGFIYLITIISIYKWGDLPLLSNPASEHGSEIDSLMVISLLLIFFVQTVTQFLLHYFAFKYKGEKGRKALFYADNNKLEFIWTIIPVITLTGLILYGLYTWQSIMNIDEENDPIIVELYAQQFNWKARYAGSDNVLGQANVRLIDNDRANILGVDESDPNAQDDIITTELHLPVGKPVLFKMRSQDVLHSAYMPHFRAQMNCVPGMETRFSFKPTISTAEMRKMPDVIAQYEKTNEQRVLDGKEEVEFNYVLLCNKICGSSHYNMQMNIIVVDTQEEFDVWYAEQKKSKSFPVLVGLEEPKSEENTTEEVIVETVVDSTAVAIVQ